MKWTEKQAEIICLKQFDFNLLTLNEIKQINEIIINSGGFKKSTSKRLNSLDFLSNSASLKLKRVK